MANKIIATQYPEGRIAVYYTWGKGAEVGSGGTCDQLYDTKPETISRSAEYLGCTELDILMAIEHIGETITL